MKRIADIVAKAACCGAIVVCGACSQVEINQQVAQAPYAGLTFRYSWGEGTDDLNKDMILIMNRVQYTHHYVEVLGADGLPLDEAATVTAWSREGEGTNGDTGDTGDTGTTEPDPENPTQPDTPEDTEPTEPAPTTPDTPDAPDEVEEDPNDGKFIGGKMQVKAGEYILCTLSKLDQGVEIPQLEEYRTNTAIAFNQLAVSLPAQKVDELKEVKQEDGSVLQWVDLNPGYPYIANTSAIYYEIQRDVVINSGTDREVAFAPQPLTMHIRIPFTLTVEKGVTITRAVAELSGIVREANLSTGTLTGDETGADTGRILFYAKQVSAEEQVNAKEDILHFEGDFHALGVFPSTQPGRIVGPGILQLAIYAEAEGKKKTFRTTKNLYNELNKAALLEMDETYGRYRAATHEATLETDYKFSITKKQVTSDSVDGVYNWDEKPIEGEL